MVDYILPNYVIRKKRRNRRLLALVVLCAFIGAGLHVLMHRSPASTICTAEWVAR